MKLAVLSGKGGTGKTFVSVNLASALEGAVYVDCDVEEPNGRLFLKPEEVEKTAVKVKSPVLNMLKCVGCRKCVEFCRFHALAFVGKKPMLFPAICHSCGGCAYLCPAGAISETEREIGSVERGMHGGHRVVTGVMNPGEESGVPLIKEALRQGFENAANTVIDCPPGSACPVMESVGEADYCVLIAEPTAFGLHNFRMVYELVSLMGKGCCAVINKQAQPYEPLESFCREHGIPVALRIPYSEELAALGAQGRIPAEEKEEYREIFLKLWDFILREAKA